MVIGHEESVIWNREASKLSDKSDLSVVRLSTETNKLVSISPSCPRPGSYGKSIIPPATKTVLTGIYYFTSVEFTAYFLDGISFPPEARPGTGTLHLFLDTYLPGAVLRCHGEAESKDAGTWGRAATAADGRSAEISGITPAASTVHMIRTGTRANRIIRWIF